MLNDRSRRSGLPYQALPRHDVELRLDRLRNRRRLGQFANPVRRRDGQRLEPLVLDVGQGGVRGVGVELHIAGDQIDQRRPAASIRDVSG